VLPIGDESWNDDDILGTLPERLLSDVYITAFGVLRRETVRGLRAGRDRVAPPCFRVPGRCSLWVMNGPKATSGWSRFGCQLRTLIGAVRRSHRARSGCEQPHSINSSAPASSIFGITMPRAFAAVRLITSSNSSVLAPEGPPASHREELD
jgi:hypothetical protein